MKQFSVQTVMRSSASKVEYGPVHHVSDPSAIEYPLTGEFQQGEYDALVDSLKMGESRTFIPQAAIYDTHVLDQCRELSPYLRTSVRVRRIA